ncbi:MAG: DNA polymerase III subunit alpha [Caldilineaceae bacterium]
MPNDFVHLHTHSEYSLLDGLGQIKKLVKEAKRLGHPALALTDHGVMHGAVEFFRACKDADIHPIIGVESYQTVWGRPMGGRDAQFDKENYHLLLLAQNMDGYRNLLKITSQSNLSGYYYKPRVDHDFLSSHAAGLVATTGCLGAEVPQLLMQGKEKEAYERLGWYVDIFGKENFFIELQEHSIPELVDVNKVLVPWAAKFGLELLATNDVHYVREEDGSPHDVLLCVQTGAKVQDEKRMRLSDRSYFMKSREQMEATFRPLVDLPASAFDNSVRIAEMCEVDLEDPTYHLPDLPIPEGFDYESYLRHLTEEGLQRLYGERADSPEIQERKERELRIIHEMGFDVYFLIVRDLCEYARSRNIWWNVRGSGAASLVAYCTGITGLDPLKNNLIFERFLNPGRVSMPDFDLDYPDDQREEMIHYTVQKYGSDQVAQIVTFGRMKARAAIRDVGRASDVMLEQVDRVAKLIPAIPGKPVTIQDVLTEGHEFYNPELVELYRKEKWVTELLDTSMQLEGVARHGGIHAAAVIVADKDLSHYTPLSRGTKTTVTQAVTQYEFPILESIGLLKVDFLGLSTLTVLREACRLIQEHHGIEYRLDNIPFEGEAAEPAFRLLSSGEVAGVFQVESQGMRRVLTEMRPSAFEHIIATISLYRPGPLEYIPLFIKRMHGDEKVEYKHPSLESILAETYGIITYQEQIIQILSQLASYTPGEADLVRRAISKKKASDIEKHKNIFVKGCEKNGIPAKTAQDIYADIEFFARYGFNKAHAADYAVITVQTAYLKALYPVEYMAALLLVERDKTEKVVNFINECRRMSIQVLPPDINYSGLDFEKQAVPPDSAQLALTKDPGLQFDFPVPQGAAIRFGMAAVKNVGEGPVNVILQNRREEGPFQSLEDFCDRVDLRQVNKRALECLIKVGALDRFGRRRPLLDVLEQMMARSGGTHSAKDSGQTSIFDMIGDAGKAQAVPITLPPVEDAKSRERLLWEKELLGVFASSHPLQQLNVDLSKIVTCSCAELNESYDDRTVTVAGMIASIRTTLTKKSDKMAFVQLEDLQGQCEVVVFPRTYLEFQEQLEQDRVVLVKGKAQSRNGRTSVLADSIQTAVDIATEIVTDEDRYQDKLLDVPTFNGADADDDNFGLTPPVDEADVDDVPRVMGGDVVREPRNGYSGHTVAVKTPAPAVVRMPEQVADAFDPFAGLDNDDLPPGETNPFSNEIPDWMLAEMGGARKEESRQASKDDKPATNGLHHPKNGKPTSDISQQAGRNGEQAAVANHPSSPASTTESPIATRYSAPHAPHNRRTLRITFSRCGQLDRDKYRLKEIVDAVRDPRGRDGFVIVMESDGTRHQLAFPNDYCTVSERLVNELRTHFRVDVGID